MENSLKAIIIGAGVVITMIVVTIGFLLMRSGQNTAQNAINRLDQMNVEMAESQYTMYDGMEIRGSELVNVLNKFKNEYIGIEVTTKKNDGGQWYIHEVSGDDGDGEITDGIVGNISETMDQEHKEYINPNGSFWGEIIRDENGTIVALRFEQK